MVKSYPKKLLNKLSDCFSSLEFDCRCENCKETLIDDRLIELLQKLRDKINRSIIITSGYRCEAYQEELRKQGKETAKGPSTHTQGQAADICVVGMMGMELENNARDVGFVSVGVGIDWIHVDLRDDKVRFWTYLK